MSRALLPTLVGTLLILATLRDVLHELFHPEDTGSMSHWVMHRSWRLLRAIGRHHRRAIHLAGPLILVAVMLMWTTLLLVGWALVYLPRLPEGFNVNPGLPARATHGMATALYVSLASMTTLGASDLTPKDGGLRLLLALESFVGPVIFTAWITWVLSIYPVLAERRAFAREVALLRHAQPRPEIAAAETPPESVVEILRSLTEQMLRISAQLGQSRVTYYFQNDAADATLARQVPYLYAFASAAERDATVPAIRHRGRLLRTAVEQFLDDVGGQYLELPHAAPEAVMGALAEDHLLPDPRVDADAAVRAEG
jgi:hypothetical protein